MIFRILIIYLLFSGASAYAGKLLTECPQRFKYLDCVKENEVKILNEYKSFITRKSNTLIIKTETGKIERVNSPKNSEGFRDSKGNINANYYFYQFLENKNAVVILMSLWEGTRYELISLKTGKSITLPENPLETGIKDIYIAFTTDNYEPYTYAINLWSITNNKLEALLSSRVKYEFVLIPDRVNDSKIDIYKGLDFEGKREQKHKVGSLNKINGKWKYNEIKIP